jgi:pyridoxal phosphate enzyme (YggS family)
MSIATQLAEVRARIAEAERAAGRAAGSVRLVAVSKTKSVEAIREAYAEGQRDFGENYAQEFAAKAEALRDLADLRWHFIGNLQANKAKLVAPVAHMLHTVASARLGAELEKRLAAAGRASLPVLVEVNAGGEEQKHGVAPGEVAALLGELAAFPRLAVRGLMTVPPAEDAEAARRAFDVLYTLRERLGGAPRLPELSMGMSADLEIAIAAGATMVRIGTAIFGSRN